MMNLPDSAPRQHEPSLPKSHSGAGFDTAGFVDRRPQAALQRKMQVLAQNSPRNQAAMQLKRLLDAAPTQTVLQEKQAAAVNNTGLPDNLKSGIESLSGMSMDSVQVHYNSPQPAQLNAHAYAQGSDIHVAPGQEKHLPHEAWHVVQQAQGRVPVTKQMKTGVAINDDAGLEAEADAMGARALQMPVASAAAGTLSSPASAAVPQLQQWKQRADTAPVQRMLEKSEDAADSWVDSRNPGAMVFQKSGLAYAQPVSEADRDDSVMDVTPESEPESDVTWLRSDRLGDVKYLNNSEQYMQNEFYWDPISTNMFTHFDDDLYAGEKGDLYRYDDGAYQKAYRFVGKGRYLDAADICYRISDSLELVRVAPDLHDADDSGSAMDVDKPPTDDDVSMMSNEEKGLQATVEIRRLADESKSLASSGARKELQSKLDALKPRYDIKQIAIVEPKSAGIPYKVTFKINPEFEVNLSGAHVIEMRSQGKGGGTTNSTVGSPATRVRWTTQTLTLPALGTKPGQSFTVGHQMNASPLSQDHAIGSTASADNDHTGMMSLLPSKTVRTITGTGSGPHYFIKGHLLNDNLGGIANEANLFPITHEANGQHKNYAEEYIKKGVDAGYVYDYAVWIDGISIGTDAGLGRHYVNSDLHFRFSRLDTAGKVIGKSTHEGKIASHYTVVGAAPFNKQLEYAGDYSKGSSKAPIPLGGEMTNVKTGSTAPSGSNSGMVQDVSASGFGYALPMHDPFAASSSASAPPQSLTSSAALVPVGQALSLYQSSPVNVVNYYSKIVTGWSPADIVNWLGAAKAAGYGKWEDIKAEAIAHKLSAPLGSAIFDGGVAYRVRVSIDGAPKGT